MIALYCLLFLVSAIAYPMSCARRASRPIPARSYSSLRTFQIKVTNPKLIASLQAARSQLAQAPAQTGCPLGTKGPLIIASKNYSLPVIPVAKPSTQTYHARVSQYKKASSNQTNLYHSDSDPVADHQTRPQILASAAGCAASGLLEYKIYKAVDDMLFSKSDDSYSISTHHESNSTQDEDDEHDDE